MRTTKVSWLLACATVLFAVACGQTEKGEPPEPAEGPLDWSVLEPGSFQVGHRLLETRYDDPTGSTVTLPVDVWYPTSDTEGEPAVYFDLVEDEDAFSEASLAATAFEGGHPVLVFSHGSNLYGGSSSYLMRHFASHGWIVTAPTHVGNTMTEFGDGDCESDVASCRPLDVWYQRPQNTMAALDALAGGSDFAAHANTDAVVLAGYSFGGYDTWARAGGVIERSTIEAACDAGGFDGGCTEAGIDALSMDFTDDRIRAAIPIAGAHGFPFGDTGRENLSVPVLQMSGTEDHDNPQYVWDSSTGTPLHWVSIEDGCHQMFSLGGCPEIEAEAGFDMIEAYTFAFARHHLLGDESEETMGLLDGTLSPWPQVSIQNR